MAQSHYHTGLSFLRASTFDRSNNQGFIPVALRSFHEDKSFSAPLAKLRPKLAGKMLHQLLLRTPAIEFMTAEEANYIARASSSPIDFTMPWGRYKSTPTQNKVIDRSLTLLNRTDKFIGEGAASVLSIPASIISEEHGIRDVPIAIIGYGPAGILANGALRTVGFKNVQIYEKRAANGIWSQPNVNGGTKNNPRELKFEGISSLGIAAGDGSKDARTVVRFLDEVRNNFNDNTEKKGVKNINASLFGDEHTLTLADGTEKSFPIVINCMGTGSPRGLNDPTRMRTLSGDRPVAVRWQQAGLTRADVDGHSFVLIGIGNSTAEMMAQLYELMDRGADCEFKILTHYPRDAVFNPSDSVPSKGKNFRIFRDLTTPDLTAFQGDLRRSRADFYRALSEGRIISDVTGWGMDGTQIFYSTKGRVTPTEHTRCTKLFALCGYQHSTDDLDDMGIPFDYETSYPTCDFDGEFRATNGVMKGYFGFGAVADAPHHRNNAVIPGMMFRLPDMIYSVIQRAAEHSLKSGSLLQ